MLSQAAQRVLENSTLSFGPAWALLWWILSHEILAAWKKTISRQAVGLCYYGLIVEAKLMKEGVWSLSETEEEAREEWEENDEEE